MRKVSASVHAIDDFNPNILKSLRGLDYIHVDVFDGKFCKNKQDNLECFKLLKDSTEIPIIAHMMVVDPVNYIDKIIDYVEIFEYHIESESDSQEIINRVKTYGKKIGVVLNPNTPISEIEHLFGKIDLVLVMSVFPGFSGQIFIPKTIEKVKKLAEYRKHHSFIIEIDGGINIENSKQLHNVDILCSASTIFNAKDPNKVIDLLKRSDDVER